MLRYIKLPDLVIPSSGTESNAIVARGNFTAVSVIAIQSPATLSGTVAIEFSLNGTDFAQLQINGTDATVPADRVIYILNPGIHSLRLVSDLAEAAERTFLVRGSESYGM